MEINSSYLNYNVYNSQPAFGSLATGLGKSAIHPELRMNLTVFNRLNYSMDNLADNIIRLQERHKKPVDIIVCGCSDGTKALEFKMGMMKRYKERNISYRQLPHIKAFDLSEDMINIARKGRINISDREWNYLQKTYPESIYKFWISQMPLLNIPGNDIKHIENQLKTKYQYSYQFNPELLKDIEFYKGDLLTELQNLNPNEPKIISCENVAVYLTKDEQEKAAEYLIKNLCPESYVIVGDRDAHCYYDKNPKEIAKYPENPTPKFIELWNEGRLTTPNAFVNKMLDQGFRNDKSISGVGTVLERLYPVSGTELYLLHHK